MDWNRFWELVAKIGGWAAVASPLVIFVFREALKAWAANLFFSRQAREKYGIDKQLMEESIETKLRASLREKLFEIKIRYIENISKEAWLVSDGLIEYYTERKTQFMFPDEPHDQKIYPEASRRINQYSSMKAAADAFVTPNLSIEASRYAKLALLTMQKIREAAAFDQIPDLSEFHAQGRILSVALRADFEDAPNQEN
jgi:hypothetical protein